MTHFLVTGASGLLGLNFALAVDGKEHQVTGVDYRNPLKWVNFKMLQMELTAPGVVERVIGEVKPDVVLHCAANANVDDCEKDPAAARKLNSDLPGVVAAAAKKHAAKMVHISTDAVFDGKTGNYSEDDLPNPLSVYASTKLEGEKPPWMPIRMPLCCGSISTAGASPANAVWPNGSYTVWPRISNSKDLPTSSFAP
jgi:dTDP-4-dehydrorhamnose reductase